MTRNNEPERQAIVDVAHEALIRHWRLLRGWIDQNRGLLRKQRQIEAGAADWREQGQKAGYLLQGLLLDEARRFQSQQSDHFPLSEPDKVYIQKSLWKRRVSLFKTAGWLIIPAAIVLAVVENYIREESVKTSYTLLQETSTYEEIHAIEYLVQGCPMQIENFLYFTERLFGNCRSLYKAPLEKSQLSLMSLKKVDLAAADLSSSDLKAANLTNSNLSATNLNEANLSYSNLVRSNFTQASFVKANLDYANIDRSVFVNADFQNASIASVNVNNSDFSFSNLESASLQNSNLNGNDLSYSNLRGANINETSFSSAELTYADFSSSNLHKVDLRNADLRRANFT